MSKIKKQLKFPDTEQAEDFFDCPMSAEQYVEMLVETDRIILPKDP